MKEIGYAEMKAEISIPDCVQREIRIGKGARSREVVR
jgi:hypothetical protein